jgi:hypothetical protein
VEHSFTQKLILIVLAGAITAGAFEFYKNFIDQPMAEAQAAYHYKATPTPTPRRF